jgi:hypothetical protein
MCAPEPLESRDHTKSVLGSTRREQPVQRGSDVVELHLEPVERCRLLRAGELMLRFERECEEPLCMTPAELVETPFGGLVFECVVAHRS